MGNNASSASDSRPFQHKEIFVRLLKNDLLQEFADVIIAFVDTNWNPNDEILQGLARIGGNKFFSEWNKVRHQKLNNCQVGDIFCVDPGSLPCRHVLFAVWREGEDTETSDLLLKFVVENMLERAKSLDSNVSSIAIPVGCGMNVETLVKILNNVFLWLMPLSSDSVTHIHFLASNEVVEHTFKNALANFKELNQPKTAEQEQTFETETNISETEEECSEEEFLETDAVKEVAGDPDIPDGQSFEPTENEASDAESGSLFRTKTFPCNGNTEQVLSSTSRGDEYPFNSPRAIPRMSSESGSEDGMLVPLNKSIDVFPDGESIWKYYDSSLDVFRSIFPKQKKSVQFEEVASEYPLETGRPVYRTLSQSSMDEVTLDYINVESKRKKKKNRPRRKSQRGNSTTLQQTDNGAPLPPFFCSICQTDKKSSSRQILSKCGHEFCSQCIEKHFSEISPSCPNCKTFYGKPLGNQPPGLMSYITHNAYLPGYPGTDTIVIDYDIPDGIQTDKHPKPGVPFKGTHRTAYLPDNEHGRRVHKLLQRAFDQRIIFTVGKSTTTGKDDVVTWNDIHHKTRVDGGPERYGYPDPEYLDRVEEQLTKAGITGDTDEI